MKHSGGLCVVCQMLILTHAAALLTELFHVSFNLITQHFHNQRGRSRDREGCHHPCLDEMLSPFLLICFGGKTKRKQCLILKKILALNLDKQTTTYKKLLVSGGVYSSLFFLDTRGLCWFFIPCPIIIISYY